MTLEEIKQLIDLTNSSGIAELEVERGGNRVRIRRTLPMAAQQEIVLHPSLTMQHQQPQPAAGSPGNGGPPDATAPIATNAADANLQLIKAPIVGTFYDGPKPGASPFVKPGDSVQAGQILCIIESMKLMNEIESETAGVVVAKLVESGRPVEYGEALFSIRPH